MEDYARISLETHLFFARIMKEHSFFLEAGFLPKDVGWVKRAEFFRRQFEELLRHTVKISNRMISGCVLNSEELVTPFTIAAERATMRLTGVPFDIALTETERALRCGRMKNTNREMMRMVYQLNRRAIWLLNDLIRFKENILREVKRCRLFTVNYPLLIEHILREARLYRATVEELMQGKDVNFQNLQKTESFWNQIMMEHAMFIRGLLDPSEEKLFETANKFAMDFKELLETAKKQDCRAGGAMTEQSLEKTKKLREFKTEGTKGILDCQIESIILPLLADHVLREANHYIRILECGYEWREV